MDLSFSRFDQDIGIAVLPPDLAVLLVGIAARQATSPTALIQQRQPGDAAPLAPLAPAGGAFNAAAAATIAGWKDE